MCRAAPGPSNSEACCRHQQDQSGPPSAWLGGEERCRGSASSSLLSTEEPEGWWAVAWEPSGPAAAACSVQPSRRCMALSKVAQAGASLTSTLASMMTSISPASSRKSWAPAGCTHDTCKENASKRAKYGVYAAPIGVMSPFALPC